jgi:hypothetical protein
MANSDEFEKAQARARRRQARYPAAVAARYDARLGKVVVSLDSGLDVAFPPAAVQGLERATGGALKTIAISPSGYGLHFPELDADLYLPALLDGFLGSKRWMAARLGASGGKSTSAAKAAASRRNGKLGGRPRKVSA